MLTVIEGRGIQVTVPSYNFHMSWLLLSAHPCQFDFEDTLESIQQLGCLCTYTPRYFTSKTR